MASKVNIISKDELESMHTGSLMSRRKALLSCEESFRLSDRYGYEPEPDPSLYIEFKDNPRWQQAYDELKAVLATRENVPSKKEKKLIRQQKAKNKA